LLGFVAVSQMVASGSLVVALGGVLFVTAIFGCVVLHEFGHALAARLFGIGTRDVTLLPIGGIARLDRMPDDPRQELWVALAGPAVNVAVAGLLGIWLFLTGLGTGSFAASLLSVNLAMVVFNMLPAFPMDGGRVLRALLSRRIGHVRATETAARIGRGAAIVFGLLGLLWSPMLILIAVFIWFGAGQEAEFTRRRAAHVVPDAHMDPWAGGPYRPFGRGRIYRVGPWIVYREE
jgi:Zn-dependent protease